MQPTGHYKQVEPHLAGSLAPGTRAMGGAKRRVEGVGWGGAGGYQTGGTACTIK